MASEIPVSTMDLGVPIPVGGATNAVAVASGTLTSRSLAGRTTSTPTWHRWLASLFESDLHRADVLVEAKWAAEGGRVRYVQKLPTSTHALCP